MSESELGFYISNTKEILKIKQKAVVLHTITQKMADQGRFDFYVVFNMSLCALGLKQLLISLHFKSYGSDITCARSEKLFEANL